MLERWYMLCTMKTISENPQGRQSTSRWSPDDAAFHALSHFDYCTCQSLLDFLSLGA